MAKKAGALEVVIALVYLGGVLWAAFELATAQTLTCERDSGVARCTAELDELLFSNTTVYDDVRNIRVIETETRGGTRYAVAVRIASGREDEVISRIDGEEARRAERWFGEGGARLQLSRASHRTATTVMIVLFFVGLAVIVFVVWRRIRRPVADPNTVFCNIRPPDQR